MPGSYQGMQSFVESKMLLRCLYMYALNDPSLQNKNMLNFSNLLAFLIDS